METLGLISIILVLLIVIRTIVIYLIEEQNDKIDYENKFKEFNKNRNIEVPESIFKQVYDFESRLGFISRINETNHVDGDNLPDEEDAKSRFILDKMNIKNAKTGSVVLFSLGFEFQNENKIIQFISSLKSLMNNDSTIIFPLNKSWAVVIKKDNELIVSAKTGN